MDHVVNEFPAAWNMPGPQPRKASAKSSSLGIPAELLGHSTNPFEVGAASVRTSTVATAVPNVAASGSGANGSGGSVAGNDGAGGDDSQVTSSDVGGSDHSGREDLKDLLEVTEEIIGEVTDILAERECEEDAAPRVDDGDGGADADDEREALASTERPSELTAAEAAPLASISDLGYVSIDREPWKSYNPCGRIHSFPTTEPMLNRSCKVSCFLHSNCSTLPFPRRALSNTQILQWLFECRPVGDGSHRLVKNRDAHLEAFEVLLGSAGIFPASCSASDAV